VTVADVADIGDRVGRSSSLSAVSREMLGRMAVVGIEADGSNRQNESINHQHFFSPSFNSFKNLSDAYLV
jgi:hypothetical protein